MKRRLALAVWLCGVALGPAIAAAGAATADALAQFEAANRLYEQGRFAEAARGYEAILKGGSFSPAVYFNLGNARFKAGELGRAVVAYRRAMQLSPRDPDVLANLRFAREQVHGPKWQPARPEQWLERLSLDEWTLLAAGAFWLALGLLAVRQVRPGLASWLRWPTRISVVAALGLGGALGTVWFEQTGRQIAVVIVREATARQGPFEESPEAFKVHDGAELRVLDGKDDWLQVGDGRRRPGWVKREAVYVLRAVGGDV